MTIELKDITLDHPDVFCALTQFQHAGYIGQAELFTALEAAGVPKNIWPKAPSDHVCLGRAVKELAGRSDRVESIQGGWVLTTVLHDKLDLEDPENDGTDAHEVSVTAKVIQEGDTQIIRVTPGDSPHAPLIRHEYTFQQERFKASEDISKWLSQHVIPHVGGVAAKARGGSYYVAKGVGLNSLKKVKEALDAVSTFVDRKFKMLDDPTKTFNIPKVTQGTSLILKPEFRALDAISIMLNGIIEETEKTCDDLHAKLIQTGDGKLGKRGLTTQIASAEALEGKLKDYSKALGLDLSDLNERLDELKAGLGVALVNETEL